MQLRDRESTTVIHELQDIKFSAESKLKAQASTITELRTALKALRSANQELLTGNYDLPQYTSPTASEAQIRAPEPLSKRPEDEAIQDELAECLMRLEGVIKVVVARARGQEPDISMLLGIEKPADHRFVRTNDREQQLGNLRNMKREIEDVRSWLCNRYAQGTRVAGVIPTPTSPPAQFQLNVWWLRPPKTIITFHRRLDIALAHRRRPFHF